MKDWASIKQEVENNGNVLTVDMETLRNAHGAAKLGVHVRTEISNALAGIGLGHVPQELPGYQHELVRLYKKGTPVGELIEIVLSPGPQHDTKLREQFSGKAVDYANIIAKIRELVAE
jgi:hypothetical protein